MGRPEWRGKDMPGARQSPAGEPLANTDSRAGDTSEQAAASDTALPATVASPAPPGRARRAVRWLRWHRLELTSVGLPLALAAFHGWAWLVPAALSAAGWAAHELHQRRKEVPDDVD